MYCTYSHDLQQYLPSATPAAEKVTFRGDTLLEVESADAAEEEATVSSKEKKNISFV